VLADIRTTWVYFNIRRDTFSCMASIPRPQQDFTQTVAHYAIVYLIMYDDLK